MRALPRSEMLVDRGRFKILLRIALRNFLERDLRWAYLINAGLVVLGVVINIFLPHGWTVWPLVGAAGIMVMVNEASDRNAVGIPPLQVYALVTVAICLWIMGAMLFSALWPLLLVCVVAPLFYYGMRGYRWQVARDRLVALRKRQGRCVHCGEPADPQYLFCTCCGMDLNALEPAAKPNLEQLSPAQMEHARQILMPQSPIAEMSRKEQQLLKRKRRKGRDAATDENNPPTRHADI
jgi:hypothetical protein